MEMLWFVGGWIALCVAGAVMRAAFGKGGAAEPGDETDEIERSRRDGVEAPKPRGVPGDAGFDAMSSSWSGPADSGAGFG